MEIIEFNEIDDLSKELIAKAIKIRERAYAPYSNFKVGAALFSDDNTFFEGINIESSDYTLTTHAEMQAINAMVVSGCLAFKAIAVVLNSSTGLSVPCGLCRQKMVEFAKNDNVRIIGYNLNNPDIVNIWQLNELIPYQFNKLSLD
jgi:cytidine deaminase